MTPERFKKMEESVGRIEQALVGDAPMGNPGLVKRVGTVEGKVKNIERERLKLVGIVTGAGAVISVLVTYVFGH